MHFVICQNLFPVAISIKDTMFFVIKSNLDVGL